MSTAADDHRSNRHYGRRFTCPVCRKVYWKRSYWVRHLATHRQGGQR